MKLIKSPVAPCEDYEALDVNVRKRSGSAIVV